MKRILTTLAALIVFTLILLWLLTSKNTARSFFAGPALPRGKVTPQLVSVGDAAILLAPDGSLWGWGGNQFQLNGLFPKPGIFSKPQPFNAGSNWVKVSASFSHILALKNDGTIWGWGNNHQGQLAQPKTNLDVLAPTQIGTESNWTDIETHNAHSLALKADGSLWAWGYNYAGQIGDGTTNDEFAPVQIGPHHDWKSIAVGAFNSYALKTNGTVWGWGFAFVAGAPAGSNNLVPVQIDPATNWSSIAASDFILLALKSDGTLWIRGQNAHVAANHYVTNSPSSFVQIGPDNDWNEIFMGTGHFFARKRDGSWWVCGGNYHGELGFGIQTRAGKWPSDPIRRTPFDFEPWAFTCGGQNTLLLAKDGTLWTWGNRLGSLEQIRGRKIKNFVAATLSRLPGHLDRFAPKDVLEDHAPYPLWELPSSIRRTLGTNSIPNESENKLKAN